MNSLICGKSVGQIYFSVINKFLKVSANRFSTEVIDPPDELKLDTEHYEGHRNDSHDVKKARLIYQSRRRGMLENDILLSTFAAEYLSKMDERQLDEYDQIINLPSNDWDIYYWATGMKPVPKEFDNSVMKLLKQHVKNADRHAHIGQPPLN